MRKSYSYIVCILLPLLSFQSCNFADEYTASPYANFDALWNILNENYCFFEYKDIDWDGIYDEYRENIEEDMDATSLFYALQDMLETLKDGHVNLFSGTLISKYEGWYEGDPFEFDKDIILQQYLHNSYSFFDETVYYKTIENGKIGYVYFQNFSESVMEGELDLMFRRLQNCSGIIIDVRNNGGGSLTNSDRLASRFFHEKTLTGYITHKTGKGRNDFSSPYPIYLESSHATLWPKEKPVVVLTNRRCYSAANNFVSKMGVLDNVTTIGVTTGGGSGLPFSSELPNGWAIRFSTSPILNLNKEHTEFGIDPDIEVIPYADGSAQLAPDPILERGIQFLLEGK